ncbi:MAG: SPOR domain-containing protein, partial [Rickettsiales bacterium]
IVCAAIASGAQAASTFLLQFGQYDSADAARTQWERLQSEHDALLGNLEFRLAEIETADGDILYRTQGGTLPNRTAAQAVCSELTEADVECMVVETSMYMPDLAPLTEVSEEMMEEGEELLSLDAEIEPAPAPKKSFAASLLPWLNDDEEEAPVEELPAPEIEAETQPMKIEPMSPLEAELAARFDSMVMSQENEAETVAPTPAEESLQVDGDVVVSRAPKNLVAPERLRESAEPAQMAAPAPVVQTQDIAPQVQTGAAEVEVAEAIRVPLSSFGERPPVPANKPVGYGGFPSQPLPDRALWVQIGYFNGKAAAMDYWNTIRYQDPEMAHLLRVRIVSPWKSRSRAMAANTRTSLRLGRDRIASLCNIASQSNLRCSLVQDMGTSASAHTTRSRLTPQARYSQRTSTARGYNRYGSGQPHGMYWVQLGAFANTVDAQQRWEGMQTTHQDVLGRLQPQISYPTLSSGRQPVYHLRTGPFVRKVGALDVCDSLKARGIGCLIVQSR